MPLSANSGNVRAARTRSEPNADDAAVVDKTLRGKNCGFNRAASVSVHGPLRKIDCFFHWLSDWVSRRSRPITRAMARLSSADRNG
jgi:hypothetical protein